MATELACPALYKVSSRTPYTPCYSIGMGS